MQPGCSTSAPSPGPSLGRGAHLFILIKGWSGADRGPCRRYHPIMGIDAPVTPRPLAATNCEVEYFGRYFIFPQGQKCKIKRLSHVPITRTNGKLFLADYLPTLTLERHTNQRPWDPGPATQLYRLDPHAHRPATQLYSQDPRSQIFFFREWPGLTCQLTTAFGRFCVRRKGGSQPGSR